MKSLLKLPITALRALSKILSKIVTTIVLTFIFIFGIGPLSLLGKIVGKDFIGEKKRDTASYWLHYEERAPTVENFMKPY